MPGRTSAIRAVRGEYQSRMPIGPSTSRSASLRWQRCFSRSRSLSVLTRDIHALRDELLYRNVPCDMSDGNNGGLLARVDLDDPARAVVAEPRNDHPITGLEPRPGVGD